jgi:hypothetical protein
LQVKTATAGSTSKFAALLWPAPGRHSSQRSPLIPPSR